MAVSILDIPNRNGDLGTRMGQGFSSGVQNGLQQLLDWKMKEYTDKQKAGRKEEAFKTVPGMTPEQAKAWGSVDDTGLQQLFLKQQMGAPQREAFSKGAGQALSGQGQPDFSQMNPKDALALGAFINQQEANKIAQQNKVTEQGAKWAKDIEPWLTKEDTRSAQINDMGDIAGHALDLLEKMGPQGYPGLIGRGIGEVSGGWLYPSVKEFNNAVGELALAKATSLKGQPTNFKIRLVQSIKPGLSADYKTNVRMLRRYKDVQEALGNRQAFRDSLKENGQFPTNIESIMSEYDNAMNTPEKHKQFFAKYPQTKEDAHFLSREYELQKMKEEDEKFGKKGPKQAAAPEIKVGAKLDKLPSASDYPGMEGMWNGKKVKSDGTNWRAA